MDTFWVDATWRVGRRHKLKLAYTSFNRDRKDYTLQREFTWGGETYDAGLSASTSSGTDILGGYYRFALVRNDRFEIGPTIGVGYLWLGAGIQATGTVGGPGGSETRSLAESTSTGSITGAVGGFVQAWAAKRLTLYGDLPLHQGHARGLRGVGHRLESRGDYYFGRHVGLGAQYKYYRYSYDRGILVSELGGEIAYKGGQVFGVVPVLSGIDPRSRRSRCSRSSASARTPGSSSSRFSRPRRSRRWRPGSSGRRCPSSRRGSGAGRYFGTCSWRRRSRAPWSRMPSLRPWRSRTAPRS